MLTIPSFGYCSDGLSTSAYMQVPLFLGQYKWQVKCAWSRLRQHLHSRKKVDVAHSKFYRARCLIDDASCHFHWHDFIESSAVQPSASLRCLQHTCYLMFTVHTVHYWYSKVSGCLNYLLLRRWTPRRIEPVA